MADQKKWDKGRQNPYHLKNFYTNIMKENALLYQYQFIVEFSGTDIADYGITSSTEPSQNISYFVQSAKIPGYKLVNGKSVFLGTEFRIPGVLQFGHNWTVEILLNQSMFAYKGLQNWRRYMSRLEIDGGGTKIIPNVQAKIYLLSPDHQSFVNSYILEGVWIKKLGDLQLAYTNGGAEPLKCSADFRYQYVYPDPDFKELDADPLKMKN